MFPIIDKKETGINLRKLMDQRGISVKDIQQYLGLAGVQSIYHWLHGRSLPSIDNFYALSQLFRVPIDEMVCGNRPRKIFETEHIRSQRLYRYYKKINENELHKIILQV